MDEEKWKKLCYFAFGLLFAVLLVWFGGKFLFTPTYLLSDTLLFILGFCLALAGIFIMTLNRSPTKSSLIAGGGLIVTSVYMFARAGGHIELPWLARIFGIACWVTAAAVLYLTWPDRHKSA